MLSRKCDLTVNTEHLLLSTQPQNVSLLLLLSKDVMQLTLLYAQNTCSTSAFKGSNCQNIH